MPRRLPPLNALRTFDVAARQLSFVQAAEELSVTPGAVSRQIKVLEEWLGAPLFVRGHKHVELTALGRVYFDAISDSLEKIAQATDRVSERLASRPLAICCYPTFALRWLVPRWRRFYDAHPTIDVQLTTSLKPVDFGRDDFDAAIQVGDRLDADTRLKAVKLVDVELLPVCAPALTRGRKALRTPADLKRATLLHNAPRPDDWARWLAFAQIDGVDARAGLRFDSLNLSIQAAIGGVGVGIAIRALVEDELASGQLVAPFASRRISSRPFFLTYPVARASDERLRLFSDWIAHEAARGP